MYIDSFLGNFITFSLFLLIVLTLVIITLGILRFVHLYSYSDTQNQLSSNPSEITPPQLDDNIPKNIALDYVKRNFSI